MKKINLNILFYLIFISLKTYSQDQAIKELGNYYKNINVFKYQFEHKQKSFHNQDTVFLKGSVIQQKFQNDSSINLLYNIKLDNGYIFISNLTDRYKVITAINSFERNSKSLGIISSEEKSALNELFFYTISNIFEPNDSNYFYFQKDTLINKKLCLKLIQKINFSNFDGYVNSVFLIEKKTYKLIFTSITSAFGNLINYEEMHILSMDFFDSISYDTFLPITLVEKYGQPIYLDSVLKTEKKEQGNLFKEKKIKKFIGKSSFNFYKLKSFDLDSSITIIDLWYMACPPCIKSIPHLNNIQLKYAEKGIKVIGINNKDFDKDSSILNSFIRKKDIGYEIILVDDYNFKQIQTSFFPTLLILDKKGIIRYIKQGFYDDMDVQIEAEINKLLNDH